MMATIWFASANANKIKQFKNFFVHESYQIKSLLDLDDKLTIVEDGTTYQANALIKVQVLQDYLQKKQMLAPNDFIVGDDTGLEIAALNNFPGLYSERWKGDMTFNQARKVLLAKLADQDNRKALMITAVVCYDCAKKVTKTFYGQLNGQIVTTITNNQGFGYEPIFYLPKQKVTLAQIPGDEKNYLSHRGKALKQLLNYLRGN